MHHHLYEGGAWSSLLSNTVSSALLDVLDDNCDDEGITTTVTQRGVGRVLDFFSTTHPRNKYNEKQRSSKIHSSNSLNKKTRYRKTASSFSLRETTYPVILEDFSVFERLNERDQLTDSSSRFDSSDSSDPCVSLGRVTETCKVDCASSRLAIDPLYSFKGYYWYNSEVSVWSTQTSVLLIPLFIRST